MKFLKLIMFIVMTLSASLNAKVTIEDFSRTAEVTSIKISPDGKHIASRVWLGDRYGVSVSEPNTGRLVYLFKFNDPNEHIGSFYWVNNERVVFTKYEQSKHNMNSYSEGQIYAGNIDGSKQVVIFGLYAKKSSNKRAVSDNRFVGSGRVISTLVNDEEDIIVQARPFGSDPDAVHTVFRVNTYTAKSKRIGKTPMGGINTKVIVDTEGNLLFADGEIFNGDYKAFVYKDSDWKAVTGNIHFERPNALWAKSDGNIVYMSGFENGKQALYEYHIKSDELTKIYQSELYDNYNYLIENKTNKIIGVDYMDGKISTKYFDESSESVKMLKKFRKAFANDYVRIISTASDGNKAIGYLRSDINDGEFYLFNKKPLSANYLGSEKSWINKEDVPKKEPIKFTARDGQLIHGYITTPAKFQGKLPLVVLVHGGPYGIQDDWFFDLLGYPLSNEGYAVLQVNYRGSGGYGIDFEELGYEKPHTEMMYDIVDGVNWAQNIDYIEKNNSCVVGWSFGGYSAAMLPSIEPDLFKCSVAGAGVYDMVFQQNNADYQKVDSVFSKVKLLYGSDKSKWKDMSPISYASKVKIPMFLVHGGRDERVPPEQAERYKAALQQNGVKVEWLYKPEEPHWFQKDRNRVEFFNKTVKFIDKYLK